MLETIHFVLDRFDHPLADRFGGDKPKRVLVNNEELTLVIEALAQELYDIEDSLDDEKSTEESRASLGWDYKVAEETLRQVKALQASPRQSPRACLKFPEGFDD